MPRRIELLLPEGLKAEIREDDTYDVPGYQIIGIEVSERIEFIPGSITVVETRRPKLVKLPPSKEEKSTAGLSNIKPASSTSKSVLIAPLPARLLAKSIADETFETELVVRKFCEHIPQYRQAQGFKRDYNWVVALSTLCYIVDCVAVALRPVHDELRRQVFSANYIQMDETGLLVLARPGPNAEGGKSKQPKPKSHKTPKGPPGKDARRHQGYMWLARDPATGLVLFEYHQGRSHVLPKQLLAEYKGYLQVDGWGAYRTALSKLTVVPKGEKVGQYDGAPILLICCVAHIRRYFFDALDSAPTEAKAALLQIQAMYAVEAEAKDFSADERLAYRKVHLAPLLEAFSEWLEQISIKVIPKASLARAIKYAVNQWPLAAPMLENGNIMLDNNLVENEVRSQALGRKNYLFAGSHGSAHNIAGLYSLMATCKS